MIALHFHFAITIFQVYNSVQQSTNHNQAHAEPPQHALELIVV